ncbi:hypothetical protein GCM10007242_26850 [Pigmentiphaga litoralis]|jgi:phage-related tail fiber protein|uniref:DUF6152 family protein n=1 Tax=Pigmentiphaga litoralis TaxID=516702 RepID=UPI0019CDFA8D|nr:DUF6152 family protein [Pigmentiphaga litoralis]GGX18644.1 hypothetical protein GCM10007242_26850 [Pigmentiphaga litoralis]
MTPIPTPRTIARRHLIQWAAVALTACAALPAFAHHGWSWAEGEQTELSGTIQSISMAPPHPTLKVKATDGAVWQIDLGNPNQTERSGFTGQSAKAGDTIKVLGNRSQNPKDMVMKAVRITLDGRNFDMYPERIQSK